MPDPLYLPNLERAGCSLRPWHPDDAPALREACGDEEICRFTTVPHVYSHDAATQWIQRQEARASDRTAIVLAILSPDFAHPVGMVGLFGLDSPERVARLGYWVIARARRRGLATSAARLLSQWAFASLGLAAIYIDREPTNLASAHVAEQLGATHTGFRTVSVKGLVYKLERHTLVR